MFWIVTITLVVGVWSAIAGSLSPFDDSAHHQRYRLCVDTVMREGDWIEQGLTLDQIEDACLNVTRNP